MAEYFAILRKVGVWPTQEAFQNSSVKDVVNRIIRARTIMDPHKCSAGMACPLKLHIGALARNAQNSHDNVKELPLGR